MKRKNQDDYDFDIIYSGSSSQNVSGSRAEKEGQEKGYWTYNDEYGDAAYEDDAYGNMGYDELADGNLRYQGAGSSNAEADMEEDWEEERLLHYPKASRTSRSAAAGKSASDKEISGKGVSDKEILGKGASDKKNCGKSASGEAWDQESEQPEKKRRKKRKKKKSFLRKLLAAALILCIAAVGLSYFTAGYVHENVNYHEIPSLSSEKLKEDGVINILLIGNDSRTQGEDGRSDAMILLSVNSETKSIYMTSLLRDMYVEIPGYKNNRLNAAYAYGGAELLMETLELNFDIEVNRYMLVNFQAFAGLVDAVGGVDIEVTSEEVKYINDYLVEYNILQGNPVGTDYMDTSISGMTHLNGPQALAYCRNRYLGTDFGRTERQRKVLTAVIAKAPQLLKNNPLALMNEVLPMITTNLTQTEMTGLILQAAPMLTYDMVSGSIPIEGSYSSATIREMSVLEVDFAANKAYIQDVIYGKGTTAAEE